jgi:hypothetical protein
MITSQRLSDLKNSTDQCEFISNLCTWRSMTTSMQIEFMRWVVFIQCLARCYISVLITVGHVIALATLSVPTISLNDFLISSYRFSSQFFFIDHSKSSCSSLWSFSSINLIKKWKNVKQLNILKSRQRYQLQCLILNHITNKMYELKIKAKTFWKYVKENKESWDSHHENERTLKKTFSTLSKMIETTRKTRNDYEKTLRRINALWKSNEKKFARNQFVQLLKNMRRCVLRSLSLNDVRRVVNLTIENRLMNFAKEMSTNKESINRNWIRMTNEKYDSFRIEFATCLNSSLTTLSSSLSLVMRFTLSSSYVTRLKEKKNRKTIFVVLFFSIVLSSIEKKKNQKTIFIDFFFDRILSSFSLTSSFIVSKFSFASQSISLWFSSRLKNIIMMFEALLKNEDCFIIHFDENLLTELIHNALSSSVLSCDSISFVMFAFVSFFFVSIVFASSFNASRFRKRVHESFSSAFKKRSRLTNDHCDCTLSSKWLEDLKKARCCDERECRVTKWSEREDFK